MLLRDTSPDRNQEIASAMRLGGAALLLGGAAIPRVVHHIGRMRAYLDQELWGWADPPGWAMEFIGGALIAASDRRVRLRTVTAPTDEKVILG
jgi:hypothetical protein